jgi:hypothetical protein
LTTIKNTFLFLVVLIISFIAIELFLSLAEINSLSSSTNDPVLGSKLISGRNQIFFNEGFSLGKVNEFGYLGKGYPYEKDTNVFRIALLGDSYVEGCQVFSRDHFGTIIEKTLKEKLNKKIEVLNFGMSGFCLIDCYCYYNNFVKKFNTDLVLFFVTDEDINTLETSNRRPKCSFENDSIKISYDFINNKVYQFREQTKWIRGKSILLGYFLGLKEKINLGLAPKILFDKYYTIFQNFSKDEQINISLSNKVMEPIIKGIILELNKQNIAFVIKNNLSDEYLSFMLQNNSTVFNPISEINNSENKNIEINYWKVTKKYGHWNHSGHQLIGKYLTEGIYNLLMEKHITEPITYKKRL